IHGTGCTLSSAIAAGLAKGLPLTEAVGAAKGYVTAALAAANRIKIGSGHGPTHHFPAWWGRESGARGLLTTGEKQEEWHENRAARVEPISGFAGRFYGHWRLQSRMKR